MNALLKFVRKNTITATLIRVAVFFILFQSFILGVRFFVWPLIKALPLYTAIIKNFSHLLPAKLLGSVLVRYILLFWSVLLCLFFYFYLEGKRLRDTAFFCPGSILKSIAVGIGATIIIDQVATVLFGSALGILQITGFTDRRWSIIIGALLLDMLIKMSNDFAEELVFRGYILQTLAPAIGPHIACISSALLFMAGHLTHSPPISLVGQIVVGLLWGYVVLVYRNIYITMGMHLGGNVFGNHVFNYYGGWLQTVSSSAHPLLNRAVLQNVYMPLLALVCFFVYKKLWRLEWSSKPLKTL